MFLGHLALQSFYVLADKFNNVPRLNTDHVIMMFALVDFEYRVPTLEVMAHHQPGIFKLCENAVYRREPDILAGIQQLLVDILGAQVARFDILENFENSKPRQGYFEPGGAKFLSLLHESILTGIMRAYYDDMAEQFQRMMFKNPMTMRKSLTLALLCTLVITGGCVYRANISQGNLIEQEDLDQAKVGMTKNQIRFLLGTPMIDDPFNRDRWDYVYYLTIGRADATRKRWVSIFFADDHVSEIRHDQELNPAL